MITGIVWTSGAVEDYLTMGGEISSPAFVESLDAALLLLRAFPEYGSKIESSDRLRRILVGRKRQFGLYYSNIGNRLIVTALLDLRQDPEHIAGILRSRIPKSQ